MPEIETKTLLCTLAQRILDSLVRPVRALVNYILMETKIMTTAQEIVDGVADLKTAVESAANSINGINLKLDEVKTKIDNLQAGSIVTQAWLDEVGAGLAAAKTLADSAKTESAAVLSEATSLAVP